MSALRQRIDAQHRQLEVLKRSLAEQEAALGEMRRALAEAALAGYRGGAGTPGADAASAAAPPPTPSAQAQAQAQAQVPAPGVPPQPAVARADVVNTIFEQPGVLTPRGRFALETSMQYAYSSSNRIALVGYTVIPAILIGLIDIREVRRTTLTAALTGRYGLTNRFEIEAKLPWVYRSDNSIGREYLQGAETVSKVFDASGSGIGDVELTGRYQFNDGGIDKPYYIGSLRLKTRTGTDPFEVLTSKTVVGFRDDGIQTELPTGSGFYGLQPALTVLYPTDPAVFFGTLSYLHTFSRSHVVRNTDIGPDPIGKVAPGGIIGFNFGMGLALNERSSFSIGYDHSSVGKTRINGKTPNAAVRVELGTLLLGYSLRLGPKRTLNLSIGAGLTRDTPDLTLTVRVPTTF
ncbi:acetate kinase [Rubrivivax gelatinosus]|nr:acetate kinase [Rubrivivax gelatinosus]